MENIMYCVYILVCLVAFGKAPSCSGASDTLKHRENNFSIVEKFIEPAKFLPNLSHNDSDNSTLQKITYDFLKMINHTNGSRNSEPSFSVAISENSESLPISNDGIAELDDNLSKKKFVVCLGFVVFMLGFFIVYSKTCKSTSQPDHTLPSIRRVDNPPPPPYYLFAPPSYEECMCGLISHESKVRTTVIAIDWPIPAESADTISSYDSKDGVNEKLIC